MKLARFALGALWTNCYVVASSDGRAVVIDPGGPAAEVIRYMKDEDLSLEWILLTHGHGDHIGGIGDIRALSANGVAIARGDASCLQDPMENMSAMMGESVTQSSADRLLEDGDRLMIGGMAITVIATPGHTRGGCCFYAVEGDERVLFSGDTLFARSIGRTDLPGGDEPTLILSLKKLQDLPDGMRVFPGHGPATTIGEEKALNPFWPR